MRPPDPLVAALERLVPGARLCATEPYPPGGVSLWLLDPNGMARPLTERETDAVWETPPYWSFCWGAGKVMAAALLAAPEWLAGKRVLDFGCGSGVVGIAAARAGAAQVICCDNNPEALNATAANAARNGVAVQLAASLDAVSGPVDLLCAADVLYDPDNLVLAERFLTRAESVLIADSRVPRFAIPGYRLVAIQTGITEPDLGELESVKQVRLYFGGTGKAPPMGGIRNPPGG